VAEVNESFRNEMLKGSGSQRAFPHNWTVEDLMAALKASLAAADKRIA